MREVLEKFDFANTLTKLDEAGLLFQVMERFKKVDLHPNAVDNTTIGHDLRGAHPEVQRGAQREPRRALHAPRRGPPHGRPPPRWRRKPPAQARRRSHRLRSLLWDGRHAHPHPGAHPDRSLQERQLPPAPDQPGRRSPSLRPRGKPRDVRHLQVRPLHEVTQRPRRREHPVREHALEGSSRRQRHSTTRSPIPPTAKTGRGTRTPYGPSTSAERPAASALASPASATASCSSCSTCWPT